MVQFIQVMLGLGVLSSKASPELRSTWDNCACAQQSETFLCSHPDTQHQLFP